MIIEDLYLIWKGRNIKSNLWLSGLVLLIMFACVDSVLEPEIVCYQSKLLFSTYLLSHLMLLLIVSG